ncbi:MAG: hypothetical protein HUU23_12080 [Caldilineales bacterium]|nr:hypothetical protein [Caldilineales bacterium]
MGRADGGQRLVRDEDLRGRFARAARRHGLDGDVDLSDLGALASFYGTTAGGSWAHGDFDYDGDVDLADLGTLASNYGAGQARFSTDWSSLTNVPEPLSALLLGLTRPEGVIYAALGLAALLPLLDRAARARLLRHTLILFVLPGLIYFLWRWAYFGHFLPNTFYVKSSGSLLHLRYFPDIYTLFRFLAPVLLLIGLGWLATERKQASRQLLLLGPALIFPWAYLLIDQLQNLGARFQYPVYPLFLLAAAWALRPLLAALPGGWTGPRLRQSLPVAAGLAFTLFALFVTLEREMLILILGLALGGLHLAAARRWLGPDNRRIAGALLLAALVIFAGQRSFRLAQGFYRTQFDDRQAIGVALHAFAGRGYTLVATEAGWLPFFSEWRAIDPFGLNDEHVVHEGLSMAYLDQVQPDVIMFHEVPDPYPPRWAEMVALLREYAAQRGFVLAAIIQRRGPQDLHIYYVRADNPDADALIALIAGQDRFIYTYRAAP